MQVFAVTVRRTKKESVHNEPVFATSAASLRLQPNGTLEIDADFGDSRSFTAAAWESFEVVAGLAPLVGVQQLPRAGKDR